MGEVSTIGLDIAKSVFQVHGVDGTGAAKAPSTRDPKRALRSIYRSLPAVRVRVLISIK
jgi:hypothetical protein